MIKNMPDLEKMSTEQKFWFARAIAGMIVADGRNDRKELNSLRDAINFLESREEIDEIMNIVKQGHCPDLVSLDIDTDQSYLILRHLVMLMAVDSVCSQKEIKFFLRIGELLNFKDHPSNDRIISSKTDSGNQLLNSNSKQSGKFEEDLKMADDEDEFEFDEPDYDYKL